MRKLSRQKISLAFKELKERTNQNQRLAAVIVILGIAALGTYLLSSSLAATPYASVGTSTGKLSSPATVVSDSTAYNGTKVVFGSVPVVTPTPSPGLPTGNYSVSGNSILNSSGQTVTIHGVDRDTLEWGCTGDTVNGAATGIPASDFTTMKTKWNANAVRIALDQDFWIPGAARYCSSYENTVNAVIQEAQAAGLIVILDLHWSDAGNLQNESPGQQCMADENSLTFWNSVASKYKSNPNVWFEMYNEPENISWSIWQNGGSVCGFNAVGMQEIYNTIRATGAENIVLAGGINYASHLDGVPILLGSNIVYAIHPYANTSDPNAWSDSDWDTRFGDLAATHPVIATEFGDFQCGNTTYDQAILDYFRAHNVGYTAWAWYVGGCNYPSLITNAAGDCVPTMGCTIQQDMEKY
jgi:endoglucanase